MIYKINSTDSYYFFKSKDIKVFPCSYRGNYTENNVTYTFDPESRLNTEYNFANLPGFTGHESYIISYDSADSLLKCVIGGYYFEINLEDIMETINKEEDNKTDSEKAFLDYLKNTSLYIKTKDIELVSTNSNTDASRTTKILNGFGSLSNTSLDVHRNNIIDIVGDNSQNAYLFTGIILGKNLTGSEYTAKLDLFTSDLNINKKELISVLYHGAGDNSLVSVATDYNGTVATITPNEASGYGSVALGYHTATSKNHQIVVGDYNADVEGEFIIGNGNKTGETITRTNSFVANGDTISINKNLTIKDGESDTDGYTTFTPDATTIKTEKFTIKDGDTDLLVIDNQSDDSKKVELKNISSTQSITLDSNKAELKHSDTSKFNLTSTDATLTAGTTSVVSSAINLGTTTANTAATINGTLTVANGKKTTLGGDLDVTGHTKLYDTLQVGTSSAPKATTLNGSLTASGITEITNSTGYSSTTTGEGDNAVTTYSAALKVAGGVHVGEKLNVANTVTMPSLTAESNKVTITNDIHLKEGGYIYNKDKTSTVNILLGSDALQVTAPTIKANGNLEVGTTTTNKNTTLNGNLTTTGTTELSTTNISGVTNITNTTEYSATTEDETTTYNAALKVDGGVHVAKKLNVNNATTLNSTLDVTGKTTIGGDLEVGNSTTKTTIKSSSINTTSVTASSIKGCTVIATGNDVSDTASKLYYETADSASDWKIKNASHTVTLVDKNGLTKLNKLEISGNSDDTTKEMFALYAGNETASKKFSIDYRGYVKAAGEIEGASFNATSDRRLKENIIPFSSEKSILDLPIYKYDYIEGTKNNIGCIAQELQEICPELVSENENGYLAVKESKLVYLLLEEIKKLEARISYLESLQK